MLYTYLGMHNNLDFFIFLHFLFLVNFLNYDLLRNIFVNLQIGKIYSQKVIELKINIEH